MRVIGGNGSNTINLQGVTLAVFPNLTSVSIDSHNGSDDITEVNLTMTSPPERGKTTFEADWETTRLMEETGTMSRMEKKGTIT